MLQFPTPSPDAQQISLRLIEAIKQDMESAGGRINFAQYMQAVLTKPQLGYYSAGNQKFGAQGDFVTAPELSPLFARCLARQCAGVLCNLSQQSGASIMEFGAGSGLMAADMLLELEQLGSLPHQYLIVEISPDLKQRQQHTLHQHAPHLMQRVLWLDTLPKNFTGVIVANEVLDAMPVHRIYKRGAELGEYFVTWNGRQFEWQRGELSDERVAKRVNDIAPLLPENFITEINLAAEAWITTMAQVLKQGVILIIDYGFPRQEYYHPQRNTGTLMCHYRHHSHADPFLYPGLQDITAHLDFSALAHAADNAGLQVAGYTNQAFFLLANGLEHLAPDVDLRHPDYIKYAQQVKTLTMPGEMGELFKVLALSQGYNFPLQGFQFHDRRATL